MERSICHHRGLGRCGCLVDKSGGCQRPGKAALADCGGDDVSDRNQVIANTANTDAERGGVHGLDVVVGVAKCNGAGQRTAFDKWAGTTSKGT